MAELADAHGLGPCAERRAGSSPVPGTISRFECVATGGPSQRSGFRLRAPAALTPAKSLKFKSCSRHYCSNNQMRLVVPLLFGLSFSRDDDLGRSAVEVEFPARDLHVKDGSVFSAMAPGFS